MLFEALGSEKSRDSCVNISEIRLRNRSLQSPQRDLEISSHNTLRFLEGLVTPRDKTRAPQCVNAQARYHTIVC